jgi:ribosomal silencing factor RsfS
MSIGQEIIEYQSTRALIEKVLDVDGNQISPYIMVYKANAEEQLTAFVTERTHRDAPAAVEALHVTNSEHGPWVVVVWRNVKRIEVMHQRIYRNHDCHGSIEAISNIEIVGDPVETVEEGIASGLAYARARGWKDYRLTIVGEE